MRIPVDSSDAAEQREIEEAQAEAEQHARREHAEQCRGGWLGEDDEGRPVPCLTCRPSLLHAQCRTCGVAYDACNRQQAARRCPCCDRHDHSRRTHPERTT